MLLGMCLLLTQACNMPAYVADQRGEVLREQVRTIHAARDPELSRRAMAMTIVEYEAMAALSPGNAELLLGLAGLYLDYADLVLEADAERAQQRRDLKTATQLRARIPDKQRRIRALAEQVLALPQDTTTYARARLLWGLAQPGQRGRKALQAATSVVPTLRDCAGLVALARMAEQAGRQLLFERAIKLCGRGSITVLVAYAQSTEDRQLRERLLREVLDAEDSQGPRGLRDEYARRRAMQLMTQPPPAPPQQAADPDDIPPQPPAQDEQPATEPAVEAG